MILLVDHHDSFVHTLARYVRELGDEAVVRRHDALTLDAVAALAPSHVVLSPGPCTPTEAALSVALVRRFGPSIPILGVCLGHQCIGAAYGAAVVRAARPMHGRTSPVAHDGRGLFAGLPSPLVVARYHSLVVDPATLPPALAVTATALDDGAVMALAHREHPVVGVQFHPESAASVHGHALLDRFLRGDGARTAALPAAADGLAAPPACPAGDPRPYS